jgi:CRISPR system Cascade subunit CasA
MKPSSTMTTPSEITFNLIHSPWIPVLDHDGTTRLVSLREAFSRAAEIRDLACGPAERISLLRLLICIAQASQPAPPRDDSPEWNDFAENLIPSALAYLGREDVSTGFDLLGDGPRFLQIATAKVGTMASSKLFLHLASGGNPTHFDHTGGDSQKMSFPDLALALLTFQNFSPLLGRGFTGRGLCVESNAAHVFQTADTLAETIVANCLSLDAIQTICPEHGLGRPIWEMMPSPPFPPKVVASVNATRSYLGRLVPLSRQLWIADPATVIIENGPSFPLTPAGREPSTCLVFNKKKNEFVLLPLKLGRAVWRDLPALAASRDAAGCPILRRNDHQDREIFVGGLVTDFKAKIEDSVNARFSGRLAIPAALFGDDESAEMARTDYYAAVAAAEIWEKSLWLALGRYFSELKVEPSRAADIRAIAQADFWDFARQSLPALFDLLRGEDFPDDTLNHPYAKTAWHAAIRDAATRAYRLHAPRGTARQLEAFTLGLKALWPKNPSKTKSA